MVADWPPSRLVSSTNHSASEDCDKLALTFRWTSEWTDMHQEPTLRKTMKLRSVDIWLPASACLVTLSKGLDRTAAFWNVRLTAVFSTASWRLERMYLLLLIPCPCRVDSFLDRAGVSPSERRATYDRRKSQSPSARPRWRTFGIGNPFALYSWGDTFHNMSSASFRGQTTLAGPK